VSNLHTITGAIDGYLASVTVATDTLYHYRRALQVAKDAWGPLPIAGLRPAHVATAMKGLAGTPAKANQFLALMKQLSGWASTQDLITQSLVEGVKTFKTNGGHKPWTVEQLAAADTHLTGAVRKGYLLYRYTGSGDRMLSSWGRHWLTKVASASSNRRASARCGARSFPNSRRR
jgi:hypothetical protein